MKFLILGQGRHGKDTLAEILNEEFGLKFSSSSQAAVDIFIFDRLKDIFLYKTSEECFNDRHRIRDVWFNLIEQYNSSDASRLAKDILKDSDIYVGMRSEREFNQCVKEGLFDKIIYVDAEERLGLTEDEKSNCIRKDHPAIDIVLTNNGTQEQFRRKVIEIYKRLIKQPFIHTLSGSHVTFLDPQESQIHLGDIFEGLAKNCRYNGQIKEFYSVAEHSCVLALLSLLHGGTWDEAKTLLFHDASEAYLGDIPTPIKEYLPDYHAMESKMTDVIFKVYGVKGMTDYCHYLDKNIVRVESEFLTIKEPSWVNSFAILNGARGILSLTRNSDVDWAFGMRLLYELIEGKDVNLKNNGAEYFMNLLERED